MPGKKYMSDYRVERVITPSGEVETKAVYQGQYYQFAQPREKILRLRRNTLITVLAVMLLLVPLLSAQGPLSHKAYVMIPVAAAFVPVCHLMAGARRLGLAQARFTREHRDKTEIRIARGSLWLTILLGLSSAGGAAYLWLESADTEAVLCVASLVLALLASLWFLPQRKKAQCQIIE